MFHRVKSEGQDNDPAPEEKLQNVSNDVEPEKAEDEASPETTVETETQTEDKSDNTKTPAKDAEEMTDTNDKQDTPETQDAQEERGFSYQRSQSAPARAAAPAGGYPGSSPYAAGGYGSTESRSENSDRRLTIGAGITMSGEIESCDYLLVEGTVEAALKGANVLDIAESGVFYGTVEIGEANIAGRFEGDIAVHGRLTIGATGVVTGSIAYKELQIEAGAVIDGKLTPLSAAPAAAEKPKKAASKAKAAPKAKEVKADEKIQEPANTDGGLFSKAAAE